MFSNRSVPGDPGLHAFSKGCGPGDPSFHVFQRKVLAWAIPVCLSSCVSLPTLDPSQAKDFGSGRASPSSSAPAHSNRQQARLAVTFLILVSPSVVSQELVCGMCCPGIFQKKSLVSSIDWCIHFNFWHCCKPPTRSVESLGPHGDPLGRPRKHL